MNISLFEIFKIFFIIGAQLIGGGYVILPLLKKYLVYDKKLINENELIDYLALSQCLPGIIALNISIFTGYRLRKFNGSLAAISGLILPSFLIIILIAPFILNAADNIYFKNIFSGVRISVIVLLFSMIFDIFKKFYKNKFSIFLFLVILFLSIYLVSPFILVIFGILCTLFYRKVVK